jgi:hypothetical protein
MTRAVLLGTLSTCVLAAQTPIFRTDSSLTLVEVVVESPRADTRPRALVTDLQRKDFRIFDNDREMPINSFDAGAQATTRPIALWLIVQCNQDLPPGYHSEFMRDKTGLLRPALEHLSAADVIGAAHWCDNGDASIDQASGHDPDAALRKTESVLQRKPVLGNNRIGEMAMQRLIRRIVSDTQQTVPARLPVFLFLYGDQCATYLDEADSILKDLLGTSGIVFGLNDGSWPCDPHAKLPRIASEAASQDAQLFCLIHYYGGETGGDVYSTRNPMLFSNALEYILTQLHLRYTIGFSPTKLDGKRHRLRVELTPEAQKRFPSAQLRNRPEYIPAPRSKSR